MRWMGTVGWAAMVLGLLTAAGCRRGEPTAASEAPAATQEEATRAPADTRAPPQAAAPSDGRAQQQPAAGTAPAQPQQVRVEARAQAQAPAAQGPAVREPERGAQRAAPAGDVNTLSAQVQALRDEVDALRGEVLRLRAGANARGAEDGRQERDAPPPVVATTTFVGTVQRVGTRQVDVRDPEGDVYTVRVDEGTRLVRGGRRIALSALTRGARVRTSVELRGGDTHASELVVLSGTRQGRR